MQRSFIAHKAALVLAVLTSLPSLAWAAEKAPLIADTPEEAALLCILPSENDKLPPGSKVDAAKTLQFLKKQMDDRDKPNGNYFFQQVDLNGDGIPEYVYGTGELIRIDGTYDSSDGATGNHSFAVVQKLKTGKYQVIFEGEGTGPYVLKTKAKGWNDLEIGGHISAAERVVSLFCWDGQTYQCQWSTSTICPDGTVTFDPFPVPPGLADLAAAQVKLPGKITDASGASFYLELKGKRYVLFELQSLAIDGKKVENMDGLANFFLFEATKDGFQLMLAQKNKGSIPFPEMDKDEKEFIFEVGDWSGEDGKRIKVRVPLALKITKNQERPNANAGSEKSGA